MSDQASKLRELMYGAPPPDRDLAPGPPMVVVTGGKGGVGTTTVAVNLAAALADRCRRVVLVDAVRQHADLAQIAGIGPISGSTLTEVLAGKCSVADALVPGPAETLLLANRGTLKARSEFSRKAQQRLLSELQALGEIADVLVVDCGNGLTPWTRRFWLRASLVIAGSTRRMLSKLKIAPQFSIAPKNWLEPGPAILSSFGSG